MWSGKLFLRQVRIPGEELLERRILALVVRINLGLKKSNRTDFSLTSYTLATLSHQVGELGGVQPAHRFLEFVVQLRGRPRNHRTERTPHPYRAHLMRFAVRSSQVRSDSVGHCQNVQKIVGKDRAGDVLLGHEIVQANGLSIHTAYTARAASPSHTLGAYPPPLRRPCRPTSPPAVPLPHLIPLAPPPALIELHVLDVTGELRGRPRVRVQVRTRVPPCLRTFALRGESAKTPIPSPRRSLQR